MNRGGPGSNQYQTKGASQVLDVGTRSAVHTAVNAPWVEPGQPRHPKIGGECRCVACHLDKYPADTLDHRTLTILKEVLESNATHSSALRETVPPEHRGWWDDQFAVEVAERAWALIEIDSALSALNAAAGATREQADEAIRYAYFHQFAADPNVTGMAVAERDDGSGFDLRVKVREHASMPQVISGVRVVYERDESPPPLRRGPQPASV